MPYSNTPVNILSSWIALEVLSPQTFRSPKDLSTSVYSAIVPFGKDTLPWKKETEKPKAGYRLYYQLIIDTIDFEKAIADLLNVYVDKRPERPDAKGEAVMAVITVDDHGFPVKFPAGILSSFAWGLKHALNKDLNKLAEWQIIEKEVTAGIEKLIRREDEFGVPLPVDQETVHRVWNYLVHICDIPEGYIKNNSFAIRGQMYAKNAEPPEPILLNSFFLGDNINALQLFKAKVSTANLNRYLGVKHPDNRKDLLNDHVILEQSVAPFMIPPARWPGPGRHPLVLLQQAAVNITLKEAAKGGMFAVNGPPGTGKTTLLRDIIAGLITERAEKMCLFKFPTDAFTDTGEKVAAGQAFFKLYKVDPRIKGFEMLIASSNNKAVENVSAELPGITAVAHDADELRYFTCLSDELMGKGSWGLVAAVLGNATNRNRFKQTFWWDKEVGINVYLSEAAGTPQFIEEEDELTGEVKARRPRIVIEENAPGGPMAAMDNWERERKGFTEALAQSRKRLEALEQVRKKVLGLAGLENKKEERKKELELVISHEEEVRETCRKNLKELADIEQKMFDAKRSLLENEQKRPGFFARLFRMTSAKRWMAAHALLTLTRDQAEASHKRLILLVGQHAALLQKEDKLLQLAQSAYDDAVHIYEEECGHIDAARNILGEHFVGLDFFQMDHEKKHLTSPWCDQETQRLRDNVFIAALKVHKAFIGAAAKPFKHNLGALMQVFSGQSLRDDSQVNLLQELWASLFLVVPGLSTTFASVEKMFKELAPESLGWLLIDEAGQALPQAATGALMRTRNAIVVGDPMQIEPVVVLPELLTHSICKQFNIDPQIYNAPAGSAQTLADEATPYFAEFDGRFGNRTVGMPLLVHRRCNNPMFNISNTIAYERLMVHAKSQGMSEIRNCLGNSKWIDIKGSGNDKWSQEEGYKVLDILQQLKDAKITPDIYIVTPFRIVSERLKALVRDAGVLSSWVEDPAKWVKERIGTVHTVQGREAEAVIFVLGAPLDEHAGARAWAGSKPNLLNVAVTRAKEVLYVIGNRQEWQYAGLFSELAANLTVKSKN